MLLLEATIAIVIAIVVGKNDPHVRAMLIALVPSIVFWQLQEFVRRVMYTERRFGAAFINDLISYGGQTLVLAGMYFGRRYWGYPFTGAMALHALAWTSAVAAGIGFWQIRGSVHRTADRHGVRENWHFGKWLAGGEIMGYFSSIHMQVLWAAWLVGMAASADLRAAQILFGPTRVIAFFLGTVLPIRFARTLHDRGMKALHHEIRVVYLVLAPMVGVYCGLLACFPEKLLHLVYGAKYVAGEAALILTLYSICAFLNYMQMVVQAALTATRQTRSIFISSVWGCFIALAASPIFIKRFQGPGAMIGMIVTTVVVTGMLILAYRRHLASPKERIAT
jgi:O-antigen/teichoic acid export membrane protein